MVKSASLKMFRAMTVVWVLLSVFNAGFLYGKYVWKGHDTVGLRAISEMVFSLVGSTAAYVQTRKTYYAARSAISS